MQNELQNAQINQINKPVKKKTKDKKVSCNFSDQNENHSDAQQYHEFKIMNESLIQLEEKFDIQKADLDQKTNENVKLHSMFD